MQFTPEQLAKARQILAAIDSEPAPPPATPTHDGPSCPYCAAPVAPERVEIGYQHCTDRSCIARWRRERLDEHGLRLMLQPKVGLQWVSDPRNLTYGKSSGR